jgi:hypothetical protein
MGTLSLNEALTALAHALTAEREHDIGRLEYALKHAAVVGVHGEAEVGKSTLTDITLGRLGRYPITVDLAAATSDHDVVWMLAKGLGRAIIRSDADPNVPSLAMLTLPDGLRPSSASRARAQLGARVGDHILELMLADHADEAQQVPLDRVLAAISATSEESASRPVLWVDHLEAPALTPRHPVDAAKLLWTIRAESQMTGLQVIVSGSKAATSLAYGKKGAFYGDGQWVTIDRPRGRFWGSVAERANIAPAAWGTGFADIADGHPPTMLIALATKTQLAGDPSPMDVWDHILALDDGLANRTLQYARQSHRLGGQVLRRIARGDGPYSGAQDQAARKEIHKVTQRLHRAGLLTQPMPRTWSITNPVVAQHLSGRPRRSPRYGPALQATQDDVGEYLGRRPGG